MDKATYEREVIAVLKGARETDLSNAIAEVNSGARFPRSIDILWLYGIDARMSDAEIVATLGSLQPVLNSFRTGFKGRVSAQIAQLTQALEKKNGRLGQKGKEGIHQAAFWAAAAEGAEKRTSTEVAGFVQAIQQQYAPYGVITKEAVHTAAQANGVLAGLSASGLSKAISQAGLTLVEPAVLPPGSNPPALQKEFAKVSGYTTFLGILFPEREQPQGFTIIDGFACRGFPPLSDEVVQAAATSLNKKGGLAAEAAKKIPTALRNAHRGGDDYSVLVYRQLIEIARRNMAGGLVATAVRSLTDLGLDKVEAGRIVLALGPGPGIVSPLRTVHEALETGRLRGARKAFSAASAKRVSDTEEEFAAAERALDELEQRVADLRSRGRAALDSGDIANGTRLLREALSNAVDDEDLAAAVAALPPMPPNTVTSSMTSAGMVALHWSVVASEEVDVPIRYVVTRKIGEAPQHHRDGTPVATTSRTEAADEDPPIGGKVFYGVTAVRGAAHSTIVTTSTVVLPPVRDVKVSVTESGFTVSWRNALAAIAVEVTVTTPAGEVLRPRVDGDRATCHGLRSGQKHVVELVAVYPAAGGILARSASVVTTAVPQAEIQPVKRITVQTEDSAEGRPLVRVSWRPTEGAVSQIWAFSEEPSLTFGQRVMVSDLSSEGGRRFEGSESGGGGQVRVTGVVSGGVTYFVAVTLDGDGESGVVGDADSLGICEPVSRAKLVRNGTEVVVSWDWPETPVVVNATWNGRSSSGAKTVRKSDYESEGGLRFSPGASKCRITLTTSLPGNEEWRSVPVVLESGEASSLVTYDVSWRNRLFGKAEATFVFRSSEAVSGGQVVIGCKEGALIPRHTTDLDVIATVTLEIEAGKSQSVEVELPKMKPPYWVRALPADPGGVRLQGPGPKSLRKA